MKESRWADEIDLDHLSNSLASTGLTKTTSTIFDWMQDVDNEALWVGALMRCIARASPRQPHPQLYVPDLPIRSPIPHLILRTILTEEDGLLLTWSASGR